MSLRLLIVEDQVSVSETLKVAATQLLARFPHSAVIIANTLALGLEYVRGIPAPDVTILDLGLPDAQEWKETLTHVPEFEARSSCIILTGHPIEEVRRLMQMGEIEIVHKGDATMWTSLVGAIIRALHRKSENLVRAAASLREAKEILANATTR